MPALARMQLQTRGPGDCRLMRRLNLPVQALRSPGGGMSGRPACTAMVNSPSHRRGTSRSCRRRPSNHRSDI